MTPSRFPKNISLRKLTMITHKVDVFTQIYNIFGDPAIIQHGQGRDIKN